MIQLGDKVTDSLTGFTGIAHQRLSSLTGCDQIAVVARSEDSNKMPQSIWFDEDRLLASVRDLAIMKSGHDPLKVAK